MAVRIRLRVKKPRNASTKFRKTSALKKAEKSLEISAFLVFSCLHLNQTRIMCLQVNLDADFVLANLDATRRNTSPLMKQGLASDRYLPGLQNHACKQIYVFLMCLTTCVLAIESPNRLPLLTKTTIPSICTIAYVTFLKIKRPKDAFPPVSEF